MNNHAVLTWTRLLHYYFAYDLMLILLFKLIRPWIAPGELLIAAKLASLQKIHLLFWRRELLFDSGFVVLVMDLAEILFVLFYLIWSHYSAYFDLVLLVLAGLVVHKHWWKFLYYFLKASHPIAFELKLWHSYLA